MEAGTVHAFRSCVMTNQYRAVPQHEPRFAMNHKLLPGLIVSLMLYGCPVFDPEESAPLSGLSAMQTDDEGEKNLAAIRALLSEERQRASFAPDSGKKRNSEPETRLWPPDWLASYFSPKHASGQKSDLISVYVPPSSSSRSIRRAAPDVTVKIPWVPAPPSRGSDAEPWPHVPAYTTPAPIGSAYPGSIRCVPDMLGGQRCQAE